MPSTSLTLKDLVTAFPDKRDLATQMGQAIDHLGMGAQKDNGVLDEAELRLALEALRAPALPSTARVNGFRRWLGSANDASTSTPSSGTSVRDLMLQVMGARASRLASPAELVAEVGAEAAARTITEEALLHDLTPLCKDPVLRRREAGDPSYRKAAQWVADELAKAGLKPLGDEQDGKRTFLQAFTWEERFVHKVSDSVNVVGVIEGKGPEPREAVMVIAHLDNLSKAEKEYYRRDQGRPIDDYEGANDNTSCVAAVIEAARALALSGGCQRDVIVLIPSAEEDGLKGTEAFMKRPPVDARQIAGAINLEMIGRNATNELLVFGGGTTREAEANPLYGRALSLAADVGTTLKPGLKYDAGEGWWQRSDHYMTAISGIPSIMLHGNATPDSYHTDDDTLEKLNLEKIKVTGQLLFRLLRDVGNDRQTLAAGDLVKPAQNCFPGRVWRPIV